MRIRGCQRQAGHDGESIGVGRAGRGVHRNAKASHTAGLLPRRSEARFGAEGSGLVCKALDGTGSALMGKHWKCSASHIALGDERKSEVVPERASCCLAGTGSAWRASASSCLERRGTERRVAASHTAERNLRSSEDGKCADASGSVGKCRAQLAMARRAVASHTAALRRGSSEVGLAGASRVPERTGPAVASHTAAACCCRSEVEQANARMAPEEIGWPRHGVSSSGSTHSGSNRAVEVGFALLCQDADWRRRFGRGSNGTGLATTTARKRAAALWA